MDDIKAWRRDDAVPSHREKTNRGLGTAMGRATSTNTMSATAARRKQPQQVRWGGPAGKSRVSTPFRNRRSSPHIHNTILERPSSCIPTDAPWLHDNANNQIRLDELQKNVTSQFKGAVKPTIPRRALDGKSIRRHGNMFFAIGNLAGFNTTGLPPAPPLYLHQRQK